MQGLVNIWLNGDQLVRDGQNAIRNELKTHLNNYPVPDQAINNLFTTDNEEFGATQDALDGIVIERDSVIKTMITTAITEQGAHANRWRGKWTSDGAYTVTEFGIGHNLNATGTTDPSAVFELPFALYSPTSFAVANLDIVIIEWELQVQ